MNHHRCSRCKEESYPRHKWQSGIFCDSCIKIVSGHKTRRGLFRGLWDKMVDWLRKVVLRKPITRQTVKARERAIYSKQKTMEARARRIPVNRAQMSPQKR